MTFINKEISTFSILGYRLNKDPRRWVQFIFVFSALCLTILGVAGASASHALFPQTFINVKSQLFFAGYNLAVAVGLVFFAFVIPKMISRFFEWRLEKAKLNEALLTHIKNNYILVDTNIPHEDQDLKKLIKRGKAILLTEAHSSETIEAKNKTLVEGLWRLDDIFLSESTLRTYLDVHTVYDLDPSVVDYMACWDSKKKDAQETIKKLRLALDWAKWLIHILDSNNIKNLATAKRSYPEFDDLESQVNQLFQSPSTENKIKAIDTWLNLLHELNKKNRDSEEEWKVRQSSLVKRITYYYLKGLRIILIAGSHHLAKKENGLWKPAAEISQGLREANIPYILLHAKAKANKEESKFWQTSPKTDKVPKSNSIFDSNFKSVFKFESIDTFPYEERKERLKKLNTSFFAKSTDISVYLMDALLILNQERKKLSSK